jgi:hypothetical protein
MPAAKACRLTGLSPLVWPHLSMITGGLTLAIVAGVALGVLDDLASSLDVWSTHSSSLLARLL